MNRVKVGFFSLSGRSTSGDDRPYLAWHMTDHMPEQYQLPGMILGQRWASTPGCRAVWAAGAGEWSLVEHVVLYLMGDPVDRTLDEFFELGRRLAELGRYPQSLPSHYLGALRFLEARADPAALISAEVVPFRPHRGIYLMVDEPGDRLQQSAFLQRMHTEALPSLVAVPGVAGVWSFATSASMRSARFTEGEHRMTVCYLDDDPVAVGERLQPVVKRIWADAPAELLLAAPYESMMAWEWDRFAPSGR